MAQDSQRPNPLANIALLAEYARGVLRLYLHINARAAGGESQDDGIPGFRLSAQKAAQILEHERPDLFVEDIQAMLKRREEMLASWLNDPPEGLYALAELAALFKLEQRDVDILIMTAAPAIDPDLQKIYAYVWDNIQKKDPDIGFIAQILSMGDPLVFEQLLERLKISAPLRKHRLILVEDRKRKDDWLDLNLVMRRIRVADRVLDFLRRQPNAETLPDVDESLASICVRLKKQVDFDALPIPESSRNALVQLARSRKLPAVFEGPSAPSQEHTALALASAMGRTLLSADIKALLDLNPELLSIRLSELIREARLGGDLIFLRGEDLPDFISGPTKMVLEKILPHENIILGVPVLPLWGVSLTSGWPIIPIPLPEAKHRLELWKKAFEGDRRMPSEEALGAIARRYEMSPAQIQKAAAEARRLAQLGRRKRIEVSELDRACRAHFAHQLSELAELVPPMPFKVDDLILPPKEKAKFEEVLLYSEEREAIYDDWGFGEKFPYGRGLSVLFYGPPGTGKTMGATIIASALGLDLFRIDLSRIMSRYVGETEKNLAKIFDEAERGRVMLLFDEADALFTKRTEVRSSVDRYANLEVAYLLQRMENFEGVTVLTTNVEHNLDDAFKRRIRYRIYFPMPDEQTRARLWKGLIPKSAPMRPDIPFELLGDYFELTGGHIKQAVLRAAFYARRERAPISLRHLVDGGTVECRELGMLISERLPKKLAQALKSEDPERYANLQTQRDSREP